MKKSRILAPALAVLSLSTAAAVTGTVAWYFAQSKVTIHSSAVTSFNPEPGLKVTLAADTGTTVSQAVSTTSADPAEVSHDLMRDGSVDLENEKFYVAELDRSSTTANPVIDGYREIAKADLQDGTYKVDATHSYPYYFATIYTAEFELTKKLGKDYALYYDNASLAVAGSSSVQECLRIGIRVDATGDYFVIAPFRKANAGAYVNGTAVANVGDYGAKVLYGYETQLEAVEDPSTHEITGYNASVTGNVTTNNLDGLKNVVDDADKDSYVGYLGVLNDDDKIAVTVYTWFEGSDAHSRANYVDDNPVQTSLSFTIAEIL